MSELGWVVIQRKMLDWQWFSDSRMVQLALYCILKANYQDTKYKGIELKRGEFITSLNSLEIELGLSTKVLRNCIDKLKSCGFLDDKTTNKYRVITVCNYSTYQCKNDDEGQAKGRQRASKGQAEGKQRATDNNINNITTKTKEQESYSCTKSQGDLRKEQVDCDFEDFWNLFRGASRGAKAKARMSYEKAIAGKILIEGKKTGEATHDWIMFSAKKMIGELKVRNQKQNQGLMDFCPHPVTWLNHARWFDYDYFEHKKNASEFDPQDAF